MSSPRVAYFTDCYSEINGVALTSRQLEAYARRRNYPFLCVHAAPGKAGTYTSETIELPRGPLAFGIDKDLAFDPLFLRQRHRVREIVKDFHPDLIHVTSPGDIGLLGALIAHQLHVPLAAAWHTNIHEFAGRRAEKFLARLPARLRSAGGAAAEALVWAAVVRFYRLARVIFAPNQELIERLRNATAKPLVLMRRGVDTTLFHPSRRQRTGDTFVLGYVGRITPEKNVRFLARLEEALRAAGRKNYRFSIIGQGSERPWLEANLRQAEFPGVLRGEPLARAYANMDLFVFPSETDTFGNVVQEALASGVPAVVTAAGGPKFLVESGVTGYVSADERGFIRCVLDLISNRERHAEMAQSARKWAEKQSWDAVFDTVFAAYSRYFLSPPSPSVLSTGPSVVKCSGAL